MSCPRSPAGLRVRAFRGRPDARGSPSIPYKRPHGLPRERRHDLPDQRAPESPPALQCRRQQRYSSISGVRAPARARSRQARFHYRRYRLVLHCRCCRRVRRFRRRPGRVCTPQRSRNWRLAPDFPGLRHPRRHPARPVRPPRRRRTGSTGAPGKPRRCRRRAHSSARRAEGPLQREPWRLARY